MEKIDLLKEASGNTDIGFSEHDIDDDFNPDEHDKRMQVPGAHQGRGFGDRKLEIPTFWKQK